MRKKALSLILSPHNDRTMLTVAEKQALHHLLRVLGDTASSKGVEEIS